MKNLISVFIIIFVLLPLLATGQQSYTYPKAVRLENMPKKLFNITKIQDKSYQSTAAKKSMQLSQFQHQTEKSGFVWITIFAGCTVLLIVAALLYRGYKQKKHLNQEIEKQQRQISLKNISLDYLTEEKEWLLKEIHHTVKNNLQIVISLLNSQSVYLENEAAIAAIRDSQHRVHSMSLIHQKLYRSDNMAAITMQVYIQELTAYLRDSFNACEIIFNIDVDNIELDAFQAVPIGLIINEAITNALKHAFKEKEGTIKIALKEIEPKQYLLLISDDGTGLPDILDSKKPKTLGMDLMQGLSGDIDGKFEIYNDNGTNIKVTFENEFFDYLTAYDSSHKNS